MLKTLTLALVLAASGISAANAQQPAVVESNGKHGQIKLDKVVAGYLSDKPGAVQTHSLDRTRPQRAGSLRIDWPGRSARSRWTNSTDEPKHVL